jgi:undecaprenyl-diphosphatase
MSDSAGQPRTSATRQPPGVVAAWAVLGTAIVTLAIIGGSGELSAFDAIVLGAVEGITEYLPISSTGHLLVTQRLLGLGEGDGKAAADTYAIAIQVGAILAVVALYRLRVVSMLRGLVGRDDDGRRLLVCLVAAFVPAAAIGFVLGDTIKDRLFGPWPIVAAWAVGGALLLWWRPTYGTRQLEQMTLRSAVIVGFAQSIALWPGVSRSLITLVAALLVGMTLAAAVEFSFLLGLATLTAATLLDLAKDGDTLLDAYGWQTPLLGTLVAFATAVVAVRWLVGYLRTRPLTIFGWYRLAAAAVTAALVLTNVI